MEDIRAEMIKDEIKNGLAQVDETLVLDYFSCSYESTKRKLTVTFTASNDSGESVDVSLDY